MISRDTLFLFFVFSCLTVLSDSWSLPPSCLLSMNLKRQPDGLVSQGTCLVSSSNHFPPRACGRETPAGMGPGRWAGEPRQPVVSWVGEPCGGHRIAPVLVYLGTSSKVERLPGDKWHGQVLVQHRWPVAPTTLNAYSRERVLVPGLLCSALIRAVIVVGPSEPARWQRGVEIA